MIISNLNHLEDLSEEINNLEGGSSTDAFLSAYAQAQGDIARVLSESKVMTFSYQGPYGSSASFTGVAGFAGAIAIDLPEMPDISTYPY